MLGLKRAEASNEYSLRKYAPTNWRCTREKGAGSMTPTTPGRQGEETSRVGGAAGGGSVTLAGRKAPPVLLTGTAARIWAAVDGARDDEAVASEVAARYDVPVEEIRTEVLTFLRHLASCQLISRTT